MPRNFDDDLQEDLGFTLRGESFTMRYVRPEVLALWQDEPQHKTEKDALAWLDKSIKQFLDQKNGAQERWDDLRKREDDPVTQGQLRGILQWMVEVQAGRPTLPQSTLGSGRGGTTATSKAG